MRTTLPRHAVRQDLADPVWRAYARHALELAADTSIDGIIRAVKSYNTDRKHRNFYKHPVTKLEYFEIIQWIRERIAASRPPSPLLPTAELGLAHSSLHRQPAPDGSVGRQVSQAKNR